jgi:hypothetical protein
MNPFNKLEMLGIRPIYERYYPLEADDIALLTSILGGPIPADLLALASRYGAAYFPGGKVTVRCIEPPPSEISDTGDLLISSLLGGGNQQHQLVKKVQLFRGRMPFHMIPFASDYDGNFFCLSTGGNDAGKVFFWDGDREVAPEDYIEQGLPVPGALAYSNLTLVADSLQDFLDRLQSREPE